MNLLIIDSLLAAGGAAFYIGESIILGKHTYAGLAIDAFFIALFIYKIFKKKLNIPSYLFPVMAMFGIIKFTVNLFTPAFNDLHILAFLAIIVLIVGERTFFMSPQKKALTQRGKKVLNNNKIPPYSISVTPDIILPGPQRLLHTQVIGSTGSGKTRFVFYPWAYQDIINNVGVFIYDIKSNMREKIEKFVMEAGREKEYYYFNLGDMASMKYNPLAGDDANEIANRVFSALYFDMQNSEQFYMDIAKRFIFSVIAVMKKKWGNITFKDLYIATSNPKLYLQPMCNQMGDDINAKYLLEFIKKPELDKNLMGLLNKLAQFATSPWTDQINTTEPEIDIAKIVAENKIFLFQANSGIYQQEYKPLSILVMMHLQSEIAKRYLNPPEKPFMIYLDEFYNVIYKSFPELINKAREANVGLIFGHQSIGDLETYGQSVKNIILTNSRNKIIFNIEDPVTAEYFAKAFGTQSIEKRSNSFSTKSGVTQSGYTIKEEEEFLVHPNDFKFIKLGEGYVKIETPDGRFIEKAKFRDIKKDIATGKVMPQRVVNTGTDKTTNFNIREAEEKPKQSLKGKFNLKDVVEGAPNNFNEMLKDSMEDKE